MSTLYALAIIEKNLDLIEMLNGGVRPVIEEKPTYFVFAAPEMPTEIPAQISFEDDLYDEQGHAKGVTFLI